MAAHDKDNEALIQRELTSAVESFSPPADLKEQIRRQIHAEQTPQSPRRSIAVRKWVFRLAPAAAAAILLVAALFWLTPTANSNGSAYAMISQALDNTEAAEWVHLTVDGYERIQEVWVSFQPLRYYAKAPGGVESYNGESRLKLGYNEKTNTLNVHVIKIEAAETLDVTGITTVRDWLNKILENSEQHGSVITEDEVRSKDRLFTVYTIPPKQGGRGMQFWVDQARDRLVRFECLAGSGDDRPIVVMLDYPETGPADIYALGVPRDAKVVGPSHTPASQPTPVATRNPSDYDIHFDMAIKEIDARKTWPETPEQVAIVYWDARNQKQFEETAILWPGSGSWDLAAMGLVDEKPVKYVFAEAKQSQETEYILVPYASESYFQKHSEYNLVMRLSNSKSDNGRYYIVSGN